MADIRESNGELVNDIQSLQQMEQQMFSQLENNPNMTSKQKKSIINKITKLSEMRVNLYKTMGGVNQFFRNALLTSQGTLKEQTIAIKMIENELNQSKEKLEILETDRNNKLRLVQINTYYGDKYAEHSHIMKIVVITLIPIIILALLHSKNIIPTKIYYALVSIISLIGAYFFWYIFVSIIHRDNMDYQNYDWYFDASSAPVSGNSNSDVSGNPWAITNGCVDSSCCSSGTIFDASSNLCIQDTSSSSTDGFADIHESMINNQLIMTSSTNRFKQNNSTNYKPNNSESFINYKL
jgi:hypothetical protein